MSSDNPCPSPHALSGRSAEFLAAIAKRGTSAAPAWQATSWGCARGASLAAMTVFNAVVWTTGAHAQEDGTGAAPKKKPADRRLAENPSGPALLPNVTVYGSPDAYNRTGRLSSPKFTESILDTPRSISIVPQAIIRDQNATNLRDIVKNIPGITIQAGEGGETPGDNFVIRGFSARTDLFIDGVRDTGGVYRDPFNIEEVEVAKGPGSSVAGRSAAGGTVNIVTKKPTDQHFVRMNASVGTSDLYRGTIDLNLPFHLGGSPAPTFDGKKTVTPIEQPNAAFRFNAVWHESDVAGRDFVDNKRWGVAPSLTLGLNTPTQVTLSYSHLDQDNTPDFGLPWVTATNNVLTSYRNQAAPVSFMNYYGIRARDFEKIRTDEALAIISHQFNDDVSLRYTAHYGRNVRDSIISAPRFINNDSSDINREFQSRDQRDTVFTNDVNITVKTETFGLKHTIVGGVEYTRENSENYLRGGPAAPLADLYDPNYEDHFSGPVRRTGAVNEADTETLSAYLFDTIKMGDKWTLSGGARFDSFDVDYTMRDAAGVVTPLTHLDKMWSWNIALAYKPSSNSTLYAAYGTSFTPSAQGLVLRADNAALNPEKTNTVEVGAKWEVFDSRLTVTAAVFHTQKENARTPGINAGDPPMVLEGEQEINGAEFTVSGNLTAKWKVIGGYTYLDTEIKKSNNPLEVGSELPGVPQHAVSLWTTYAITPEFQVGAGMNYVGERFANPINTRQADSYTTFDAMAAYRVNEHFTVQVNVLNLTDEEYISGLHIAGSFGHFIPGQGRTAILSAAVEF